MEQEYSRMPFADYQAVDAINATSLKAGRQSMRAMLATMQGGAKEPTPAMLWGSLVHLRVLEPERFDEDVQVVDVTSKRVKAWKEAVEEHGAENVITAAEHTKLCDLCDVVYANPHACDILAMMETERSLFWEDDRYGAAKCRIDLYHDNHGICDLKTSASIDSDAFARSAWNLGYPLQLAWYREGVRRMTGEKLPVSIIALTSNPPYDCRVFTLDTDEWKSVLDFQLVQAEFLARQYRECEKLHIFPGVSDIVEPLPIPGWADTCEDEEWEVA